MGPDAARRFQRTARTTSRCPAWTSAGSATSSRSRSRASTSCPIRSRTPRSPSPCCPSRCSRSARSSRCATRCAPCRASAWPRARAAAGRATTSPCAASRPATTSTSTGCATSASTARDTFNLESVEVLKGPSAVLFGRGSTGGIINQVSKSPKLTPFYELSGTVGNGPQGRVAVDVNQPIGGSGALRLNLMGFKGETPGRDLRGRSSAWARRRPFGIGLNGPTRFIVSYFYLNDDNMPDYGFPYLLGKPAPVDRPVRRENFYGIPDRDYEHDDVHIGTLRFEHDFNENVRLRNTLRLAMIDRGSLVSIPAIVGTPTAATPLERDPGVAHRHPAEPAGHERHQHHRPGGEVQDVEVQAHPGRGRRGLPRDVRHPALHLHRRAERQRSSTRTTSRISRAWGGSRTSTAPRRRPRSASTRWTRWRSPTSGRSWAACATTSSTPTSATASRPRSSRGPTRR